LCSKQPQQEMLAADQGHPISVDRYVAVNLRRSSKTLEVLDRMLRRSLLVAGCFLLAQGSAFAADAKQGKAIAERWCSGRHVVEHEQKTAPSDQAPPLKRDGIKLNPDRALGCCLRMIFGKPLHTFPDHALASPAARPDFSADRLALLLLAPHPNMPKLALSRFEVADLAEYILMLK
jgi:hypothetical protein